MEFIEKIDRVNTDSIIVSASLDCWVKPFSEHFNMKLIATKAKYENNIFKGEFMTKNCTGKEKVNRIKQIVDVKGYDKTVAFGDSPGDKDMFIWADEHYYQPFH